jgi:hypothetical protein
MEEKEGEGKGEKNESIGRERMEEKEKGTVDKRQKSQEKRKKNPPIRSPGGIRRSPQSPKKRAHWGTIRL